MPAKRYRVTLTESERHGLNERVRKGKGAARSLYRARVMLLADESGPTGGWKDAEIVEALGISRCTVERIRQRCVEAGVEAALYHKQPRRSRAKVLDGEAEAHLVQLACSETPDGRERWSMQMLADKLVELEVVETVSAETVRTTLKKTTTAKLDEGCAE